MITRVEFLNKICQTENNSRDKFLNVISNHYFKYDYLYKLCRELWEDDEIGSDIQNIDSESEQYALILTIEFSNEEILDKAYEVVDEYLFNVTDKGLEGLVERDSNILTIILKTDYLEEEYYI